MPPDRLQLACGPGVGRALADVVARVASAAGLGERQAYRLRLAADELATNIATHGYHGVAGPLAVEIGCDADWVWLRLEDEAPPFDPRGHDDPPPAGEPRLGGYGIYLALSGVDRFAYDRVGGRNRSTLSMRRPTAGAISEPALEGGGTDVRADRARRR